jgi:RNA polymerase sigma-70 factor, ECF subfamily
VLRKQPHVDSEPQLKAWIKVVARNATLSYLRKMKRSGLSLEAYLGHFEPMTAAGGESVEHEVETRSLEETITYHVDRMRPDHRAILELKWKKGLSYKEIADEVKETEGMVRSKLHTARTYLKKVLHQDWRGSK